MLMLTGSGHKLIKEEVVMFGFGNKAEGSASIY